MHCALNCTTKFYMYGSALNHFYFGIQKSLILVWKYFSRCIYNIIDVIATLTPLCMILMINVREFEDIVNTGYLFNIIFILASFGVFRVFRLFKFAKNYDTVQVLFLALKVRYCGSTAKGCILPVDVLHYTWCSHKIFLLVQYWTFMLQHTDSCPTQHQWVITQSFAASDCLIILHNLIQ